MGKGSALTQPALLEGKSLVRSCRRAAEVLCCSLVWKRSESNSKLRPFSFAGHHFALSAFVLCILLMEILFLFGQNNSGLRTELHVEVGKKGTRYPS